MISKKGILVLLVSLLVVGGMLVSCVPGAAPTPPKGTAAAPAPTPKPAAEKARPGGILTRSSWADPASMDLHQEISIAALIPFSPIYNKLIKFDPSEHDKIVADLAERWEVNTKGDVYTFYLRKGVKWHDGKPFTAEDAAYSLMRMSHPKDFGVVSPRGEATVGAIKKAQAVDDMTVQVELSDPQASFLRFAAVDWIKIMPKHTILANQGNMKQVVNGTGPFKLKTFARGVIIHLVKNPDYFVKGQPYLDEYKLYPIADATTAFVALRTGRVHMTSFGSRSIAPEQADWVKANMADKIVVGTHKSTTQITLDINHAKAPWSDLRVRRAMDLAIDRKNMRAILKDYADVGLVHYADGLWGIPAKEVLQKPGWREPKDPDIAEAKRLMAEAGYSRGIKTTLLTREGINYADYAQAVQRELAQIGIEATIQQRMTPEVVDRGSGGNFDLMLNLWTHNEDDPSMIYRGIYLSNKSRKKDGFSDQQIDTWFAEQEGMMDDNRRREIVRKMADRVLSLVPGVILAWPSYLYAYWREVKGFSPGPCCANNHLLEDVWLAR
ncbi:MAG: ABC transporter substrate-binding protein [Chloroflexi bacterium]|nr:ABC transporter substrate-binding protein [Chloroflexota bacterium]